MTKEALTELRNMRVKVITVTPELVLDLLWVPPGGTVIDGRKLTVTGDAIPDGAKVRRAMMNKRGDIVLMIEHETFPEVPKGEMVESLIPTYQRE